MIFIFRCICTNYIIHLLCTNAVMQYLSSVDLDLNIPQPFFATLERKFEVREPRSLPDRNSEHASSRRARSSLGTEHGTSGVW